MRRLVVCKLGARPAAKWPGEGGAWRGRKGTPQPNENGLREAPSPPFFFSTHTFGKVSRTKQTSFTCRVAPAPGPGEHLVRRRVPALEPEDRVCVVKHGRPLGEDVLGGAEEVEGAVAFGEEQFDTDTCEWPASRLCSLRRTHAPMAHGVCVWRG